MSALTNSVPRAALSGLAVAVTGWAAVVALAVAALAAMALACWVLASTARTTRLTRIINALRGNDAPTPTRADVPGKPDKTLTQ